MAATKLKTGNRKTSISRDEVRNVIVRSAETGKFTEKSYVPISPKTLEKKKK